MNIKFVTTTTVKNHYPTAVMPQITIRVSTKAIVDGIEYPKLSYSMPNTPSNVKLAARLAKAIEDGKVFVNCEMSKTAEGKPYLKSDIRVFGRSMNADLKRIGY